MLWINRLLPRPDWPTKTTFCWRRMKAPGQPVVAHQGLHDPRFLQLTRGTLTPVESQDRRLGRALVYFQHAHAQGCQTGHLRRRRQTLEAVEHFQLRAPHTRHQRRQLTPTPQRTRHRGLRRRIRQAVAAITLAQLRKRLGAHQQRRTLVTHCLHARVSCRKDAIEEGNGRRPCGRRPAPSSSPKQTEGR